MKKVQNLPKLKKYVLNTLQLTDFQFMIIIILKFCTFHPNLIWYLTKSSIIEVDGNNFILTLSTYWHKVVQFKSSNQGLVFGKKIFFSKIFILDFMVGHCVLYYLFIIALFSPLFWGHCEVSIEQHSVVRPLPSDGCK